VIVVNSIWAPVVAALGASLFTTLGLQWHRWRDDKAKAKAAKLAAYSELHARIFSFQRRVGTLALAKQFRSGLSEGLSVTFRQRKPVDVFELHEWLDADFKAITDSYSRICAIGSQEAIDSACRLVNLCGELTETAVASDPEQSQFTRRVKGERQTELAVQVALGDSQTAIRLGERIDTDSLPTVLRGRRSQVHLELGWAAVGQGDDSLAVLHLLEAERVAKQAVSRNAAARTLLTTLLARERKSATPGLRALATRARVGQ
jgi:hypothetical protein